MLLLASLCRSKDSPHFVPSTKFPAIILQHPTTTSIPLDSAIPHAQHSILSFRLRNGASITAEGVQLDEVVHFHRWAHYPAREIRWLDSVNYCLSALKVIDLVWVCSSGDGSGRYVRSKTKLASSLHLGFRIAMPKASSSPKVTCMSPASFCIWLRTPSLV